MPQRELEHSRPDFVVRLVGSGVKPWTVPLRALSKLMDAIQRLVEQSEEEDREVIPAEPQNQEEELIPALGSNVLKLVQIRSSSAGYALATPYRESALNILSSTGRAIEDPSNSEWSAPTISSLKDVSEIAKSLGVKIEIRKPKKGSKLGDVIAKITPTTYTEVANAAFVRGQTTVFGTIERIGGAQDARCAVRVSEQSKLVYCDLASDELAKRLAPYLYQAVSLHGEATWLRTNWRLTNFEIRSFDPPKTGSFKDALADIWRAGGKAWDKVEDPDRFIAKLRGA
jgi:hypothetical protein